MNEGYRYRRIGDLISDGLLAINDGYRMRNRELGAAGIPFVRGGDISNGRINHEVIDHIRPEFADRVSKKRTMRWDVAFITKGTVGRVGIIRPEQPSVVFAPQVAYWRSLDHEKLWPRFIYYLLCGSDFQACLDADKTHGSMVADYISISQQHNFSLLIPPIERQREIARTLGAIDDKIELNRRINETLEAMAQALFKSWFVDFDPVIDNALAAGNDIPEPLKVRAAARRALGDARKPLPEEIRREFPDDFEFRDEMGWVPQGWEISSLDSIADYRNGLALQKYRPADDSEYLPVLKIAQLRVDEPTHAEKASVDIPEDYVVHDGDVVFSWSGSLMLRIWCGGPAALNQHLFRVTSEKFPKWFYFEWTKTHLEDFKRAAADKAVTMGHIKRSHLKEAKCVVPSARLIEHGTDYFAPILGREIATRLESRALGSLRDNLLPKLLSGELALPAAEKLAADVL